MSAPELRITKLERSPEGYWRARVSANGETVQVDRRYGSWQIEARAAPRSQTFVRKDVQAPVAARLQAHVRPIEARERRAAQRAQEALQAPQNEQ